MFSVSRVFAALKLPKVHPFALRWTSYVPNHEPCAESDVKKLADFLTENEKILVVTGAGVSTESGIPDYRSEGVGLYAKSSSRPVIFRDFVRNREIRRRYWAKNYIGWPRFSSIQPNQSHICIRALQARDIITCVITQNVDNLHVKANSPSVIELHGTAFKVICLSCDYTIDRYSFQKLLFSRNPTVKAVPIELNPDGDIAIDDDVLTKFEMVDCPKCGGILKPDIVFFGDNVPRQRVEEVNTKMKESQSVLVLGTSLTTYSSYRIIQDFANQKKPIGIVNIGATRADPISSFKISARCGELLPKVLGALPNSLRSVSV